MLHDLFVTFPIWFVAIIGCFLLLLDTFGDQGSRRYLGPLSAGGALAAVGVIWLLWGRADLAFETPMFRGMMVMGNLELAACSLLLIIAAVVSLMASDHAEEQGFAHGELYALIHFAVFGMMVMATATHFATLFVGLEIMSIAVYILAAVKRSSPLSAEAGLKYFLLGAFSSGILLYGAAFIYGETAALEYNAIREALAAKAEHSGYLGLGLAMLGVAFAFKIALVPFHMWTPDVYEGAPPPVTALMATGVKAAAVVAMARFFGAALPGTVIGAELDRDFLNAMSLFAILTILVGNTVALHQTSLKRMLGYSSIAHAGYLVIGVLALHIAPSTSGLGALNFYLFTYALANLAVFAVLSWVVRGRDEDATFDSIAGLAKTRPFAAVVLALGMLSLAGVPPTAGFFGKLELFRAALDAEPEGSRRILYLVIAAMLGSVVSVYYYLRVIVYAYFKEPIVAPGTDAPPEAPAPGRPLLAAWVLTAVGIVYVGMFPGRAVRVSQGIADNRPAIAATFNAPPANTPALVRPAAPAQPPVPTPAH